MVKQLLNLGVIPPPVGFKSCCKLKILTTKEKEPIN